MSETITELITPVGGNGIELERAALPEFELHSRRVQFVATSAPARNAYPSLL
jgi:hypothetical protein